jgi:Ca-activated chloride channel family protein
MRTASILLGAVLVSTAMLWAPNAFADDSSAEIAVQVNQGNVLLRQGNFKDAIAAYEQARSVAPQNPNVSYNEAVAQYRKGDLAAAERLFESAATSDEDLIAHKARFNRGNCSYASALQFAEKDRASAIKELEKAIENYRAALEIDASDSDARANIELANKLMEKLREENNKQERNQAQQQKQNQDRDQKSEHQPQQQQNSEKSKDGSRNKQEQQQNRGKPQSQKSQQSETAQNGQPDASDGNPDANKKTGDQSSQPQNQSNQKQQGSQSNSEQKPAQQPNARNDASEQPKKKSSTPRKAQQATGGEKEQGRPTGADSAEQQGKEPRKGTLSASEQNGKTAGQDKEAETFDPVRDGAMTRQEAEKMLQAIRDREMIRRLQRQSAERSRHVPVDRDW